MLIFQVVREVVQIMLACLPEVGSRAREILEGPELAEVLLAKTTPEAVEVVRDQRVLMELGTKEEKAVTGEPLL
jgi:hypothetical protein